MRRKGTCEPAALLVVIVAVILLTIGFAIFRGCSGPPKEDLAYSRLCQVLEGWNGDGTFEFSESDPWGRPYRSKVTRDAVYIELELRCDGRDGLPYTRDDIVVRKIIKHGSITREAGKVVGTLGHDGGKGLAEGVREGLRSPLPGDKEKK
jgi:hypothetical protein